MKRHLAASGLDEGLGHRYGGRFSVKRWVGAGPASGSSSGAGSGPVRMGRAGVDLELGGHLGAQAVVGQHADDGLADRLGRVVEGLGVGPILPEWRYRILRSALPAVSTILLALTTTTWSPVSRFGVNMALCLPRRRRATSVAMRPRTRPSASTRCRTARSAGCYVGTGLPVSNVGTRARRAKQGPRGQRYERAGAAATPSVSCALCQAANPSRAATTTIPAPTTAEERGGAEGGEVPTREAGIEERHRRVHLGGRWGSDRRWS